MRYPAEFRAVAPLDPGRSCGSSRHHRRRGAVLVEFALIALVLYLLLAVTIEMGRSLYSAQLVQQVADVAAREISRIPLPPNPEVTLERILYDRKLPSNARVLRDIYNEDYLVVDLDQLAPGQTFVDFFANKPIVNRQLMPLMIYQEVGGRRLLRYPGALFTSSTAPSGLTVAIPMVVTRAGDGSETIEWHRVVEEVKSLTSASTSTTPSGLGSGSNTGVLPPVAGISPTPTPQPATPSVLSLFPITSPQRGLVALRVNFPYQAAALSAYQPQLAASTGAEPTNIPVGANDGGVRVQPSQLGGFTPPGAPIDPGQEAGPYAGPYGLGRQFALDTTVRPFSKLLIAQAIYRREVFGNPEGVP